MVETALLSLFVLVVKAPIMLEALFRFLRRKNQKEKSISGIRVAVPIIRCVLVLIIQRPLLPEPRRKSPYTPAAPYLQSTSQQAGLSRAAGLQSTFILFS
jgi:hypothetical protein